MDLRLRPMWDNLFLLQKLEEKPELSLQSCQTTLVFFCRSLPTFFLLFSFTIYFQDFFTSVLKNIVKSMFVVVQDGCTFDRNQTLSWWPLSLRDVPSTVDNTPVYFHPYVGINFFTVLNSIFTPSSLGCQPFGTSSPTSVNVGCFRHPGTRLGGVGAFLHTNIGKMWWGSSKTYPIE